MLARSRLHSKHGQLAQELRQRVLVDNLAPGDRFMTVREIAQKYSVSTVTAHKSIRQLIAEKLLVMRRPHGCFVASQIGTLRNRAVKPLITVLTNGPFLQGAEDSLPDSFVRGICHSIPLSRLRVEYVPATVEAAFPLMEALVGSPAVRPGMHAFVLRSVDAATKRFFAERGLPAVVSGNLEPSIDLPCVQRDERQIAYTVTRYLLAKGHARIAYIEWDAPRAGHDFRRAGFAAALEEVDAGTGSTDRRLLRVPINEARLVEQLRSLLGRSESPTAVIFGQERHAAWAIRAARDMRITVPRDLAMVCLGGGVLLEHLVPRMTAVPRRDYEDGIAVGNYLGKLLKGEPIADRFYTLSAELTEGETT